MPIKCTCTHPFQDTRYGYLLRWHNPTAEGWRCTVCGHEKKMTSEEYREKAMKKLTEMDYRILAA